MLNQVHRDKPRPVILVCLENIPRPHLSDMADTGNLSFALSTPPFKLRERGLHRETRFHLTRKVGWSPPEYQCFQDTNLVEVSGLCHY